ncbi:MAG: phosphatase PAP2 family protein [Spartobacteria bacterium]
MQDRLSPQGYLGLHLTVGMLIIVLGCWWFGGIVEDLLTGDPLVVVDQRLADWFHQHATGTITEIAKVITFLGSVAFLSSASFLCALFLLWRKSWRALLVLVLTMGAGTVLNIVLKHIFHRQRPIFEDPLTTLSSFGFPSGHTMGATLFYGLLAMFLATGVAREWRWRMFVFPLSILLILLIGLSRIYLGAHYLSDVMGAMAAAIVWLAVCWTAVETFAGRSRP